MRPFVVVHSAVSVDGAVTGFVPDLAEHYRIAEALRCDAHLVGSNTIRTGIKMAGEPLVEPWSPSDEAPTGREGAPWWFVVDSRGGLRAELPALRAFPGLRDVVVLVSRSTPQAHLADLARRHYRFLVNGDDHVDLAAALRAMATEYAVERVLVDSGPTLTSLLLDQGLVDEVSLVVHPLVVGHAGRRLFAGVRRSNALKSLAVERLSSGATHMRFAVRRD